MWNRHCAFGLLLFLPACSDSPSPTVPTPSGTPPVQVNFSLAEEGALSVSAPVPCAVDRDANSCPSGLQRQLGVSTGIERTDTYTLPPGTYLLTGQAHGNASTSAVTLRIGLSGGVDKTWGGSVYLGALGGASAVPRSIVEGACVKTFTNDSGAVEWGVIFRVAADGAPEQLCR